MTLDQIMNTPVEDRRKWTEHEAGLNYDCQPCCMRCGAPMPRLIPTFRHVYTFQDRLYIEQDIPDATPCRAPRDRWVVQR
jgi:hypothetical protein